MNIRCYSELSKLISFKDRFEYLKLNGKIGEDTFGFDRYLNQNFYKSNDWKKVRDFVIVRDNGCDLGIEGRDIFGKILIHHLNPITINDIKNGNEVLLDSEFLISTTIETHNAIHYGDDHLLILDFVERKKNDTCLWKQS